MDDDLGLIDRLRAGDEAAFADLVRRYQPRLLRLAEATVHNRAVAEEVCQDTWLGVLRGLERFEGRASFRTWLFRILLNRARTSAGKEARAGRPGEEGVDRFDASGAWSDPPVPWSDRVDDRVVAEHLARRVQELLPLLPDQQRQVVLLRDVEGLPPDEVSSLLGVTDGNQRVLLHRARVKLRSLLSAEIGGAR